MEDESPNVTADALAVPGVPSLTPPRWNWALLPVVFIGLVVVDRLAVVAPLRMFPITPWNPLIGISVALAIINPARGMLFAFTGALITGLLAPGGPTSWALGLLDGTAAAVQTIAIGIIARRVSSRATHYLVRNRLVSAILVSPIVAACVGAAYVAALSYLSATEFASSELQFIRYWVGSVVGIVIFAPIFAVRHIPGRTEPLTFLRLIEALTQAALVMATVWVAFGEFPQTASRYLFVILLPMIWIVLRFGVRGAIAMNLIAQVSMLGSLLIAAHSDVNFTLFQALLLVLSTSAFIFGLAVDQSKAATQQLRAREEELSASLSVAATGELAGTLAHELGHPLGAISNYASALNHVLRKIAPDNAEAAAIGAKLTQEVVRATDTLHRMRDFFRTGMLVVESADIAAIVKEAVTLLKDRLGHNAISPYIVVQGGAPVALGDKVQLRAVVYNLLVNAIDALKPLAPEARALAITIRRNDAAVTLEIEDSGHGVAADVRDDIFEPLVTTKKDGLGLGLSMSRSIVHAHNGTIVLTDSRLGGAKFIITLPVEL